MDRKKFLNLLKNLQTIMKCPSCGADYVTDEIHFVGQQDGYFLLSMTCQKCSLPVWVNFFAGSDTPPSKMPVSDLTYFDMDLAQKSAITKDEVITFHSFIKTFNGDFKKHIKNVQR